MDIAIIGTGISGLGAAYLLHPHHNITVFEKNDYIGGHSRTVDAIDTPVDTGFIVFNYRCYPHLSALFERLNVPVQESSMSFGVSINNGWLEYGTESGLGDLFAQKKNLFRPAFWGMLRDILKFNKKAADYLNDPRDLTLGQCLQEMGMGEWFRQYYLLAMGGAIWSCPLDIMLDYPAKTFIRFFENHGLLTVNDQPQWYTVKGGSREYIQRLAVDFADRIQSNAPVTSVRRADGKVYVSIGGAAEQAFDRVIMSGHADQSLAMIADPTEDERTVLGAFKYEENKIILHSDKSFMPGRRKAWSSWVYMAEQAEGDQQLSLSYWMNNLQQLPDNKDLFVTLNPGRRPQEDLIYDEYTFEHPVFDQAAIDAQAQIHKIQGVNGLYFAGAWQRYGFHEDGLLSAVRVAEKMGIKIPWL